MNFPIRLAPLLLAFWASANAAVPDQAKTEINALLDFIGHSQCSFYRNGSWHDARAAEDHVRDKYRYLSARDKIGSTEDFIARAATRSSLSGADYKVRCPGRAEAPSAQWLLDELAHERAARRR